MEVLIIEGNQRLRLQLAERLTQEGYHCTLCDNGTDALHLLSKPSFDTILLDTALGEITGLNVLRELRTRGLDTPVMLLSAQSSISERVLGLDSGADDYLVKPFHMDEMCARVRRMLRNYHRDACRPDADIHCLADLTVDTKRHIATRSGKRIPLSEKECAILEYLICNQGMTLTRECIEEHVSKHIPTGGAVISVYIHYLRRKIDDGHTVKLLHTIRNGGYVLRADNPKMAMRRS